MSAAGGAAGDAGSLQSPWQVSASASLRALISIQGMLGEQLRAAVLTVLINLV